MSRGGFRGGRGGGRGGKQERPWQEDPGLKIDSRPAEVFPPYSVPIPAPVSAREKSQVNSYLLFREQMHDGPFYTATRSWNAYTSSGSTTPRAYGQDQINQRYGIKNKSTVDPFTAVEMRYSRLRRPERALPDFGERPFTKSLFPPELHATIHDEDHPAGALKRTRKKKTMTLSKVTALRTAEEIFNMPDPNTIVTAEDAAKQQQKMFDALEQIEDAGGADEDEFDLDDEQGYEEEMDEAYEEDEDGGDYDAEGYFDNGDDDHMDEGGGDEGVF